MDALLGPPGSAARQRRRLALAAALGLATVIAWRASRKDSLARQKARAAVAALQRCAESAVQWSAACATKGVLQGGEAWLRRHPELNAGSEGRQQLQSLLQSVLGQVLSRLDGAVSAIGSPHDVLTLAVERSTRSVVMTAYELMERRQRQSTSRQQQQQQTAPDPTADAEGVTDSEARGAAAAAIATAAGFPFIGQVLRRFWSPDTEDVMTRYLTVLARTVVETYIDKSSFPSCALLPSYDAMCAPFLKPEHQGAVSGLVRAVTREAVSTYLAPPVQQQPLSSEGSVTASQHGLQRVDSNGWVDALKGVKDCAVSIAAQVRQAPGTALTVPIVVYATWRGTALGVHDAFARSGVNGHGGTSVVLVFDSAVRLFWAVFMCLAAFVLCAQLMRAALVRA